jgi:hypothetical protein
MQIKIFLVPRNFIAYYFKSKTKFLSFLWFEITSRTDRLNRFPFKIK